MHSRPLLYKFLAVRRIPLKKYFNSLPIACHPERSELRGYVNMAGLCDYEAPRITLYDP